MTIVPASAVPEGLAPVLGRVLVFAMIVAALALLAACANVANACLAAVSDRSAEIAVRMALGASRVDVARQWLVESLVVSGAATGLGLLLALWMRDAFLALRPLAGLDNLSPVATIDWRVGHVRGGPDDAHDLSVRIAPGAARVLRRSCPTHQGGHPDHHRRSQFVGKRRSRLGAGGGLARAAGRLGTARTEHVGRTRLRPGLRHVASRGGSSDRERTRPRRRQELRVPRGHDGTCASTARRARRNGRRRRAARLERRATWYRHPGLRAARRREVLRGCEQRGLAGVLRCDGHPLAPRPRIRRARWSPRRAGRGRGERNDGAPLLAGRRPARARDRSRGWADGERGRHRARHLVQHPG